MDRLCQALKYKKTTALRQSKDINLAIPFPFVTLQSACTLLNIFKMLVTILSALLSFGVVGSVRAAPTGPTNTTTITDWSQITPSIDIRWIPCFESFSCTRLIVPLDYEETNVGNTSIAFIKYTPDNATSDANDVLFNPGWWLVSSKSLQRFLCATILIDSYRWSRRLRCRNNPQPIRQLHYHLRLLLQLDRLRPPWCREQRAQHRLFQRRLEARPQFRTHSSQPIPPQLRRGSQRRIPHDKRIWRLLRSEVECDG